MEQTILNLVILAERYHKGTLTPYQKAWLEAWMAEHEDNRRYVMAKTEPERINKLAIVYLNLLRRKCDGRRKENRKK